MANSLQSYNQQEQQTYYQEPGSKEIIGPPVVVTGFGTIDPNVTLNDESNLSWRVVEMLSKTIDYKDMKIPIIKGKPSQDNGGPEPVKVCYSYVIEDNSDDSFHKWLFP